MGVAANPPASNSAPTADPAESPFNDRLGRAYCAAIPAAERRTRGEFYTPEWLADEVLNAAEYDGSGRAADPACGSGVFLLRMLRRNIGASVAGFDTCAAAVNAARQQWAWATKREPAEAPVAIRDTILGGPPDSAFEWIVGNPPWINWRNLDPATRSATAPLWSFYGLFPHRGIQARLGAGMDDLSALATYVWSDRWTRTGGRVALILPQTLLQSAGGGSGFRRFDLPGGRKLQVVRAVDFEARPCFPGTSARGVILVLEAGRGATSFPVPYRRGGEEREAYPVSTEPGAPWVIIRRGRRESLDHLRGPSAYRARVGAHSGGASGVFWVDVLGTRENCVAIANRADAGRRQFDRVRCEVERVWVRRLLRGRDVRAGSAAPSCSIVLAYDSRNKGKAVGEARLRAESPLTWEYFNRFRQPLLNRPHYRRHFPGAPPWSLYNVGDYTFAPHRVVWREQASDLVVATVHDPDVVADAKLSVVACDSADEARFLAAVLLSEPVREFVRAYTVKTQISTHVLRYVAVPQYDPASGLHREIAERGTPEAVCELWGIREGIRR